MKKTIMTLLAISGLAAADVTTWSETEGDKSLTASGTSIQSWDVSGSGMSWTGTAESIIWTIDVKALDTSKTYTLLSFKDASFNSLGNVYIKDSALYVSQYGSPHKYSSEALKNLITEDTKTLTISWDHTAEASLTVSVYTNNNFDTAAWTSTEWSGVSYGDKAFQTLYFGGYNGTATNSSLLPANTDASSWTLLGAGYTTGAVATAEDLKAYYTATVQNVPEPTTATLSLLALAGLAARRRRK